MAPARASSSSSIGKSTSKKDDKADSKSCCALFGSALHEIFVVPLAWLFSRTVCGEQPRAAPSTRAALLKAVGLPQRLAPKSARERSPFLRRDRPGAASHCPGPDAMRPFAGACVRDG